MNKHLACVFLSVILVGCDAGTPDANLALKPAITSPVKPMPITEPTQMFPESPPEDFGLIRHQVIKRGGLVHYDVQYDVRVFLVNDRLPLKQELVAIAKYLHSREKKNDRTHVYFFLPGMKVCSEAFAFAAAYRDKDIDIWKFNDRIPDEYWHLKYHHMPVGLGSNMENPHQ